MILCIDTATAFAGVALVSTDKCFYEPLQAGEYSESILPAIDKIFKKARKKPADLTGVLVIKGPGSFTSLRVGIAVANQFAHQFGIPILGLRTDEWWAHRTDTQDVICLQTMNRDEVYTGGKIVPIGSFKDSAKYFGELSDEHRAALPPDFQEITGLKSAKDTWVAMANNIKWPPRKTYALVEPFYGKEPTITKAKQHY